MNYMKDELGIWEIAVLALLREAPMHPYQMQRLLKDRHKDEILVLKRGSLYHAIGRLERAGLIAVETTGRQGKRPERTTYRLAPAGQAALGEGLRNRISYPKRESSEFMAAMSFLVHLAPAEATGLLRERLRRLQDEIDVLSAGLADASRFVQRINLVESEYLLAMLRAEWAWVRALEQDTESGRLTWDLDAILRGEDRHRAAAGEAKEKP